MSLLAPLTMSDTSSLYVLQDIPRKGRGLVAACKIPKGTRILSESPLFQLSHQATSMQSFLLSVAAKVAALSDNERQAFFSIHNSHPDLSEEVGIIKTNALPLGSNASKSGIFLESSRMNHACKQNAQNTWNENIKKLTIHAIQDIEQGSEITIMYMGERPDYATRQRTLKAKFRFDCACDLCSLPITRRKITDSRLREMEKLDKSIGDGVSIIASPLKTLHDVRRLLNLFKMEGFTDPSVPRAYYDAFQIAVTHGDLARAKVFAESALSTRIVVEGDDSPGVKDLQKLVKKPSQHRNHGLSSKWKSTIRDLPQGLEEEDFENWLWRVEKPHNFQLADLRNEANFPAFKKLPWENILDLDSYQPSKHWAFFGEIVNIETLWRVRLIVKDKDDHLLPIAFYTDVRGREISPSMLRVGYTVAILYAEQHGFLDLSFGIRHEDQKTLKVNISIDPGRFLVFIANIYDVQVLPVSLDNLMLLSDKVQTHATLTDGMRTCHGCNKKSASLMKCAKCGCFWYCDKVRIPNLPKLKTR
ncbi:hypothetical protein FSARC_2821 [Fusarium sarcochroum]|uniref:SET domain-containing protein n=1 Tax=Fusarium sarcochroum TaxID=1208366 RepID=A0A8H4U5S1_9HYPO|nr:hypothetical protein FSARC_2821 [Fusarium sarcochroum]